MEESIPKSVPILNNQEKQETFSYSTKLPLRFKIIISFFYLYLICVVAISAYKLLWSILGFYAPILLISVPIFILSWRSILNREKYGFISTAIIVGIALVVNLIRMKDMMFEMARYNWQMPSWSYSELQDSLLAYLVLVIVTISLISNWKYIRK